MSEAIVPIVETEPTEMSRKEKTELLLRALGHNEATTSVHKTDLLVAVEGLEALLKRVSKSVAVTYTELATREEELKTLCGLPHNDTNSNEWQTWVTKDVHAPIEDLLFSSEDGFDQWAELKAILEIRDGLNEELAIVYSNMRTIKQEPEAGRIDILEQIGKAVAAIDVVAPPRPEPVPNYLIGTESGEATVLPFESRPTSVTPAQNLETVSRIITEHREETT